MKTLKNTNVRFSSIVLLALFVAASFGLQACETSGENGLSFDGITNSFEEPPVDSALDQITLSEKESAKCNENHTGIVIISNATDEIVTFFVDDESIGELRPHTKMKFVVSSGSHTIYRENPPSSDTHLTKLFSFTLKDCETYYCGI